MKLREIFEASETTAVMAFGRMNPPTIGHAKLVDAVVSQGGDPYIFLSQSQKPKTDPLAFEDKLRYAKFFFPNVTIGNPEVKTIIQALQKVEALGYANLIYVAGSDRIASFEKLLNDYNGKEYNFNSIKVVSAGERDPDADGAEGMSASKMRAAAAEGDLESFKQGVPQQEVADEMYAAVRQGMGIKDAVPVQGVAEAPDADFLKFMNKSLGDKVDAKSATKKTGLDSYNNAKPMSQDSEGYSEALKFSVTTLQKLTPGQKVKLATRGEDGVVTWLTNQATKQGLVPDTFVEEDIDESQDFLSDIFKDPAITSWALLLTNGDPLPKPPAKAPFKIVMNKGIAPCKNSDGTMNGGGYSPGDDDIVDVVDSKPEADEMFDGLVSKNPTYYFWMRDANGKLLKQHQPNTRPKTEGVAEHKGVKHRYQMTHPDGSKMKFTAKDDADARRQAKAHGAKSLTKQQNKKKSS